MKFYNAKNYQPACLKLFKHFKRGINRLLPKARVEHIGSSSIPNAISKGDLDIYIGVDAADLENAVLKLKILGFKEKTNTLRTTELCMLESTSQDVALQVVANGSDFENFLTFRDRLCCHPDLVKQYNLLKKSCEGMTHQDYRNKKSEFIQQVLADQNI